MAMAIVFLLWVGFGGPKPPAPTLSFSTEGCKNDHLFENITRTRIESLVTSARDTGIEYELVILLFQLSPDFESIFVPFADTSTCTEYLISGIRQLVSVSLSLEDGSSAGCSNVAVWPEIR